MPLLTELISYIAIGLLAERSRMKKRIQSFRHAFRGIRILFRDEANAWIHLLALILVSSAGLYFRISMQEWSAIALTAGMIMGLEALNTAIEKLADRVSKEHEERIAVVKDLCAGGVLLASLAAVVIAGIIFIPEILEEF